MYEEYFPEKSKLISYLQAWAIVFLFYLIIEMMVMLDG